jgi:hypothetical protein
MLILEVTLSPNEEKYYQRNHDDNDRSKLISSAVARDPPPAGDESVSTVPYKMLDQNNAVVHRAILVG